MIKEGCVSGVASARRESGSIKAGKGWNSVRERTRRSVSSVRWVCHGGGSGDDEVTPVSRGAIAFGFMVALGLDFVIAELTGTKIDFEGRRTCRYENVDLFSFCYLVEAEGSALICIPAMCPLGNPE